MVVALVQADARLIEDIQNAHERRADVRRQANTLAFTAGKRRRRTGKRQIFETHVAQKAET